MLASGKFKYKLNVVLSTLSQEAEPRSLKPQKPARWLLTIPSLLALVFCSFLFTSPTEPEMGPLQGPVCSSAGHVSIESSTALVLAPFSLFRSLGSWVPRILPGYGWRGWTCANM